MSLRWLIFIIVIISCTQYSASKKENPLLKLLLNIISAVIIRPEILIFSLLKNGVSFLILISNKIFHVTVFLVIYFCRQFVAPEIRHSRRHCSVCQHSTWYSAMRQDFDNKFVFEGYTANKLTCEFRRWLFLIMQFIFTFFLVC